MKFKLLGVVFLVACVGQLNLKAPTDKSTLVPVSLLIKVPAAPTLARYVSSNTASVGVTLNSVDGAAPAQGLTTSVVTTIATDTCTSGCTADGPDSPPGDDNFTIVAYDAQSNPLSSFTGTFTINAGMKNQLTATLVAVSATLSLGALPSASANTPFTAPSTITVAMLDASGAPITGTYANPITLTDSDTSDLTEGSSLSVNGGAAATSVQVTASTDVVTLNYGGLAIAPATITASATAATDVTATFAPVLSAISYSGPQVAGAPEVDLYGTSGPGAQGTFSLSEVGWSNAPYSQAFTATADPSCSSIATVSSTDNLNFTVTLATSPSAGSCPIAVTDGAGQSLSVDVTYTQTQITIQ